MISFNGVIEVLRNLTGLAKTIWPFGQNKSQIAKMPKYKKEYHKKYGAIWEFEVFGPNIENHGQPKPLCPKDHSDLVPTSLAYLDDDWNEDITGEQVMSCPDCGKTFSFDFDYYEDLLSNVRSSYRGKKRREQQGGWISRLIMKIRRD